MPWSKSAECFAAAVSGRFPFRKLSVKLVQISGWSVNSNQIIIFLMKTGKHCFLKDSTLQYEWEEKASSHFEIGACEIPGTYEMKRQGVATDGKKPTGEIL